jgi:PAS domain S-box-containing protein
MCTARVSARDDTETSEVRADAAGPASPQELEQELGRLRMLVDHSRDMLFLHDLRGRVLEINRYVHERLGYTREQFLGLSVGDFTPDVAKVPLARRGENWARMPLDSSVTVETHVTNKDGDVVPVEILVAPFEEQGQRLFVAVGRDISERKAAEAARRRDELRFQAVFEGAPTGLVLIDNSDSIIAANPAIERMLEAPSGSLIGKTLADITVESDLQVGVRDLVELRSGLREHVIAETRYRGPEGKVVWGQLSAFRYRDPETDEHRIVAFIEDISERKRIEDQRREMFERLDELVAQRTAALELEIAERKRTERELSRATRAAEAANLAKSQFLASMSHELRTPLNAVIGYSEMLIEEAEDTGGQALVPDLERIRNAGKHLLHIINDILDLSKIEAGKIELYIENVDLRALISEIAATIQPLADTNNNQLVLTLDLGATQLTTDVTRVRQVLFNLLSNACKFTERGRVELHARDVIDEEGRAWVCCDIRDTGLGIKPEQLIKLFAPFTQADASTSRRFGGTGLGLSISDRFAKMLGGRIEVTSEYGVGSTFSLWLPTSHTQPPAPSVAERIAAATGGTTGTVLVVDDESEQRNLLVGLLEGEGYTVMTAPNGAVALELAAAHKPDVITLDVLMPGMDGWATLARLKQQPALCDIPVVIVSMKPDNDMGYALGAADVLSKPIERDRLLGILERFGVGGPKHVLVVDDDDEARELVRRAVVKGGWQVQEARNGVEALAAMRARKPRLVVLDLMMPEMDGFEVLEHLRADPKLRSLPVIIVTAKELGEDERRTLSQRVGSIMQKASYSRTDLIEHLRSLMTRSLGPG